MSEMKRRDRGVWFVIFLMVAAVIALLNQEKIDGALKKRRIEAAPAARLAPEPQKAPAAPAEPPKASGPRIWPPPASQKVQMAGLLTASNYLIIFDASGSMSDRQCSGDMAKIDVARLAVKNFIASQEAGSNTALLAFGATPTGRFFEQDFISSGAEVIGQALDRVAAGGKTPLQEALSKGYLMLERQAQRQGGYGQYHMVIITDGVSTDGDPSPMARAIAGSSAIQIHTIGFCLDGEHSLSLPGYTNYSTANDPAALAEGLQAVLAETESFDSAEFMEQ